MDFQKEKCAEGLIHLNAKREVIPADMKESKDVYYLASLMYDLILDGWMYGYGQTYSKGDYTGLFNQIREIVLKRLPLRFLLPAFPCKSPNTEAKVLGSSPDFAEFLAVQSLIITARKLQQIYPMGITVTIMSDYHTFDQYIGVTEENYKIYHEGLKEMIDNAGADDIIELLSLSSFPQFCEVPESEISKRLETEYGDPNFLINFDRSIKENSTLMEKYLGLRKFMGTDQSHNFPGSPKSSRAQRYLRQLARGIMSQGVALDKFLQVQSYIKDFIRLSIHDHHPQSRKFAVDLFKHAAYSRGILRTPWHHAVVFDSLKGEFTIDHKANILAMFEDKLSTLVNVQYNGREWFYLQLNFSEDYGAALNNEEIQFEVKMIKQACGITVINKSSNRSLKSECLHTECLTNLIKEFGVVVLRGFQPFKDETEFIETYSKRATHGIVNWKFGLIHKVVPSDHLAGIVNSKSALNIHFDFTNPPQYMQISQSKHKYEEYVPREFILYCRKSDLKGKEGATTFIDGHGAVMSLNGERNLTLKNTVVAYQTALAKGEGRALYFGGRGNIYEYPLVHVCPWTGKDVLRWQESWTEEEHPETSQYFWFEVRSYPDEVIPNPADLDSEIKQIAFDERFYFEHGYEEGDQVYVNNYTMLHGRKSFSNSRELWRLQALPQSDNLPAYFSGAN